MSLDTEALRLAKREMETDSAPVKTPDFNGGYIKYSKEAYNLLIKQGYYSYYPAVEEKYLKPLYMGVGGLALFYIGAELPGPLKQFYINNGELSWDAPETSVPKCDTCGQIGVHTGEPHQCLPHTPWYEELKPGTIVVDGRDHPYIAREYRHGMLFDFNDNLIGKTCHLRLATAVEAGSLYHE